jgi:TonB family protein
MLDSAMLLEEDLPLDVELAINAIETPLGRYAAGIDQLMRDAWKPPLEAQLMSGYGVTTVTFRVDARGRVTDKEITRMSGISGLDIAALVAVPDKVPRPDRELLAPGEHLHVTYTFRHSSPIVSRSAQH